MVARRPFGLSMTRFSYARLLARLLESPERNRRKARLLHSRLILPFLVAMLMFAASSSMKPMQAAGPLPGQIIVDPNNPRWLTYEGGGPFFLAGPGDPEPKR